MPVKHVFHPMTIHVSERATSFQTVVLGLVTLIDLNFLKPHDVILSGGGPTNS